MNQKTILIALIVISVASAVTIGEWGETLETITQQHQNKYLFPRTQQSCTAPSKYTPDEITKAITVQYGWYWDQQVCQPCAHIYCQCTAFRECDSCLTGYTKIDNSVSSSSWGSCHKCPSLSNITGKTKSGSAAQRSYLFQSEYHYEVSDAQHLIQPEADECQIFQNYEHDHLWQYTKKGLTSGSTQSSNYHHWRKGLRNTVCGSDDIARGIVFQKYGSICWYIIGCSTYNKWGKCDICMDGYYKTNNQYCKSCRKTCVSNWSDEYVYGPTGGDCTGTTSNGCSICAAEHQCTVCAAGFYKVTPADYIQIHADKRITRRSLYLGNEWNLLDDASWCAPCPGGCNCSKKSDAISAEFNEKNFILTAMVGHYLNQKENTCKLCNDKVTGCKECSVPQATGFACSRCHNWFRNGDKPRFYYPVPVKQGQECQVCPEFCSRCTLLLEASTCEEHHCFNGYRSVVNDAGVRTCSVCTGGNAVRCTTDNNGNEKITQCETGSEGSQSYDQTQFAYTDISSVTITNFEVQSIPEMNFYPPSIKDYHLISNSNGESKCMPNLYSCWKMDENGTCESCYAKRYLSADKKCVTCNVTGCSECNTDGKCKTCTGGLPPTKNNTCLTCAGNCKKCTLNAEQTQTECSSCGAGFYLPEGYTTCQECNVQNCADCAGNHDSCVTCKERFTLWDEKIKGSEPELNTQRKNLVCETCEYGCLKCVQGNRKICELCEEEMYLHGGVCHHRLDHCVEFLGLDNKCSWCKHGYRLTKDFYCVECFSPELGTIHCPTECEGDNCFYSTVNNTHLLDLEGDAPEPEI